MIITTEGVVISVNDINEQDRFLKIFSPYMGVISVMAKGVRKQNASSSASAQLFACAVFCLNETKGRYYLNSSRIKSIFYELRCDMRRLALASYMAQLVQKGVTENQTAKDIYSLFMNSLYMLCQKNTDCDMVKLIFELRFSTEMGMIPALLGCADCYCETGLYFLVNDGTFFCHRHLAERNAENRQDAVKISDGIFSAMRYICLSDMKKIFNFRLSPKAQNILGAICEDYCRCHLDLDASALKFYKELTAAETENNIKEK